MKIAYIITAYIDADQLKRLVDSLMVTPKDGCTDFYIHIDKKVDIAPFVEVLREYKNNIYFTERRYWINWGGYNQVRSQYELLRMIFEKTKKLYDRIVCLSGTDYPLWSNRKIHETFTQNSTIEYIGGYNLVKSGDKAQKKKIQIYHFFRDLELSLKYRRLFSYSARVIMRILQIRKPLYLEGKDGNIYNTYTGSDYWGLTYDCAHMVFETMKEDAILMKYFKTSYIPSENVVNTIVLNSSYKKNVIIHNEDKNYPGLEALTPLHYTSYRDSIKIYILEDWDELMKANKMFFRKARTGVSDSLIEKLEKQRIDE